MAVNQPHHGGKSHSGPKWLLVLLGVVALLFATLAATTTFVDGDRVAASMQAPGRIVFELGTQSPTDTREIWVMDSDGGNLIQLTDNEVADRMPNWSPSGKEITFSNSNRDIYVMNADRTNVRQLTDLGDFLTNGPVQSPNGEEIAFYHADKDGDRDIYVMNADGSNIRNITDTTTEDFRPQWSPNGKKIVFYSTRDGGDRDIIVMNADGSKVRQLTKNDVFRDFLPRWSPNGEQIVFDSNRDGKRNIYLMDVNSKKVKQLTSHPKADIHPAWSPNGKEILFSSNRSGSFKTYVMSSEGEDVRKIAEHVAIQPHWSANGR